MTTPARQQVQVVIPAHRGASVLHRSLQGLAGQRFDGEIHAVVAVNPPSDPTLAVALQLCAELQRPGLRLEVITTRPGRPSAINEAEQRFDSLALRLYLDQDARLSPTGVSALVRALGRGDVHFVTGRVRAATGSDLVGRAYCSMWACLPYVQRSCASMGLFAVSAKGRERWSTLPDVRSDDKWVRLHFAGSERLMVAASYEVCPPAGLRSLMDARRRYRAGNRELAHRYPELVAQDVSRAMGTSVRVT